jgi:tRNA-splicing ligase RtcB (3'-phosphate/5'-hydroxy nucleic acid ligase)
MISKEILKKISDVLWEIPKSFRDDMCVPARVYASEKMLNDIISDRSLEQLVNVATLFGIQEKALAMPDIHEGYGFPIGGVAAMEHPDGIISPGGIGYDINCGVRLLKSELSFKDVEKHLESLAREIYHWVPSGVGRGGQLKLSDEDMNEILQTGVKWMVKQGYATQDDLGHIESYGCLTNADPNVVFERAKNRGRDQLGTLGAGNHFVEVDVVEEILDEKIAKTFGLFKNQMVVLIHTGSRGLGHQVATDYIRKMMDDSEKYGLKLPDRELIGVPFSSPEGTMYFNAMAAAANFAWSNRQMISWEVGKAWERQLGDTGGKLKLLYDVAHNIAKIEDHDIGGKTKKVIVHRKGATRAFGPGHPEIAEEYRSSGQPVLIPGSMGTASYVLAGAQGAMLQTFGSTCHGAGRRMSRKAAKKQVHGRELRDKLKEKGIFIQAGSMSGLAEEAPMAYKDIDDVIEIVNKAGIANKVAKLRPCVVVKG